MTSFIDTLNAFGGWLVGYLGRLSLELAILAIVVWLALRLLPVRSPALRHLFWCLVLAKPVATFLVASPVSLYWFLTPATPTPVPHVAAPVAVYVPAAGMRPMPRYRGGSSRPDAPLEQMVSKPALPPLERQGLIGAAWLALAGAFLLRLVVGWAYVSFLRSSAVIQRDGPLPEMVRQMAVELGVRRHVDVATSELRHGPVLAGVWHPLILLPNALTRELPAKQLRFILAHELSHVRRWDNLVLLVQRLAEMFLFFHPAVWLCGRVMRREAEAACDDAVIAVYGDSAAYADSLVRVAEFNGGLTRRLLVNTFAATESHLGRRVRRILEGRTGRMTMGLGAAVLAALALIGCLGLPTAARKATPAKPACSLPIWPMSTAP